MSVSEHANYLLNEYGRLQFDYAAYCKPNGESLRNEARNNLETYIAELEADNNRLKCSYDTQTETFVYGKDSKPIPCPFCGEIVKECNDVATPIDVALRKRIAKLEAENAELKERVAMLDVTAVFKSLGEMGYIEQTNKLHTRIAELEAANELHRNINHKVAIALGLKSGDSWHDLPKRVIDLCERKDELEMFVDQLVEAGDEMSDQSYWNENKWLALVKGWKEREE